jgi:hypothetical protein
MLRLEPINGNNQKSDAEQISHPYNAITIHSCLLSMRHIFH